jgi:predicted NAD/FAD-dependent oxidoreductase
MKHNIAIIGAGMAGITAARTLLKAGHRVEVFEKSHGAGGRMSTRDTVFGSFDHGAQYFTVRDPRFSLALQTVPGTDKVCRPWSANAVRVLDPLGHVFEAARPSREAHFVVTPGMNGLVRYWAAPLGEHLNTNIQVQRLERNAKGLWTLHGIDTHDHQDSAWAHSGFDRVILAVPSVQAQQLLRNSAKALGKSAVFKDIESVEVAPCWTLMLAFPQASQPGLPHLGPQWNAARSTHHRVAWLARESSKPGRGRIERWTVQASAIWSQEHLEDSAERVQAKLLRAFSELTGIRAEPSHADVHLWRYAQTMQPLEQHYLFDKKLGLGTCGDWHIGHRVEDAFVSGLELALAIA